MRYPKRQSAVRGAAQAIALIALSSPIAWSQPAHASAIVLERGVFDPGGDVDSLIFLDDSFRGWDVYLIADNPLTRLQIAEHVSFHFDYVCDPGVCNDYGDQFDEAYLAVTRPVAGGAAGRLIYPGDFHERIGDPGDGYDYYERHNLVYIGVFGLYDTATGPTHYTIYAAAAPEPSAWALMIAGLGLAGATLRRRRTPHAACSLTRVLETHKGLLVEFEDPEAFFEAR